MYEFAKLNELDLLNNRLEEFNYTFENVRNQKSIIDFVFCRNTDVTPAYVHRHFTNETDHNLVVCSFTIELLKTKLHEINSVEKIRLKKLQGVRDDMQFKYVDALLNNLKLRKLLITYRVTTIEDFIKRMNAEILLVAKNLCGVRSSCMRHNKGWWIDAVRAAYNNLICCTHAVRSENMREFDKLSRRAKRNYMNELSEKKIF